MCFGKCESALLFSGVGANAVPQVPEEQAADSQPAAPEASSSPMDVDSPTQGFACFWWSDFQL